MGEEEEGDEKGFDESWAATQSLPPGAHFGSTASRSVLNWPSPRMRPYCTCCRNAALDPGNFAEQAASCLASCLAKFVPAGSERVVARTRRHGLKAQGHGLEKEQQNFTLKASVPYKANRLVLPREQKGVEAQHAERRT